jgi:carboxymethylenebutenolidase
MTDLKIKTAQVKVPNGELQISSYLAEPVGEGPFPGVIVIQEIFGVNAHIRDVTERIAKEGYVAMAPAIYQRQAPDFEVGYTDEDIATGRKYKEQTKASELLSDVQSAVDYLKGLSSVKKDSFGCIGFCFGGHVTYLAATLPDIKAAASFYGAGITTGTPGGGPATITLTPKITGTVYCFFGTQDSLIPNEQTEEIETELKKHQINHKVFRYPADHGFFCDRRADYNAEAAADSWMHVKELFERELKAD